MKKLALSIAFLAFLTSCEKEDIVPISEINQNPGATSTNPSDPGYWGLKEFTDVPDQLFEEFLVEQKLDDVVDGKLNTRNAMAYTGTINYKKLVGGRQTEMKSVQGIEAFVNITGLEIVGCKVTSINLKNATKIKYIAVGGTNVSNLDLSKCTELEEVMCHNNENYKDANGNLMWGGYLGLTSLDLTNNLKVKNIWVWANRLKTLKVNHLKNLQVLWVNHNPELESLDLTNMPNLYQIIANDCPKLNYINIKGTYLRQLDPSNPMVKASVPVYFNTENCPSLTKAFVQNVPLVSTYAASNSNFWKKDAQTAYTEAP